MILKALNKFSNKFSVLKIPIADVGPFLKGKDNDDEECKRVAEAFHKLGCLIIKDPRVNQR